MPDESKHCPACAGSHTFEIYRLDAIPVQSCIILDSAEAAQNFPRRPLVLRFCDDCGFVYNAVFDLAMVDYSSTTEESQHFSGTFNRFAKDLAAEVAATYELNGKLTLEIGCGKGEFLKELAELSGTRGLGVDPGFIPERLASDSATQIGFRKEFFDPANITEAPDLIACRHTLEHVPEVGRFLSEIAEVVDDRNGIGIFFETPDVRRVLEEGAYWDIYYEHCSYFSLGSHARLFRRAGMDVTRLYLAYDGQYIVQYAELSEGRDPLPNEDDIDAMRALARAFPEKVAATRKYWTDFVTGRHAEGKRVAIWGGGSKGVSFLTTNGLGDKVSYVIDINPYKQGRYMPGTGHLVSTPEALREDPPGTVIVMNPNYLSEIGASLHEMGLDPELVAV